MIAEYASLILFIGSIVVGRVLIWRLARRHRPLYAVGLGIFIISVFYVIVFLIAQSQYSESLRQKTCWDWCGLELFLIAGTGLAATIALAVLGSLLIWLMRKRSKRATISR